jgi:uncharacterized protein (TIGR03905 family)
MKFTYKTNGVCSRSIDIEIENGIVKSVSFMGGCNGNLKAISKLIEGMDAQKVIEILKGNDCGGRGTSCADQLAIALEEAMKAGNNE